MLNEISQKEKENTKMFSAYVSWKRQNKESNSNESKLSYSDFGNVTIEGFELVSGLKRTKWYSERNIKSHLWALTIDL